MWGPRTLNADDDDDDVESFPVINYFLLTGSVLSWGGEPPSSARKKYGETWDPIVKFSVARHKMVIS